MSWTEERIDRLKKLWSKGSTASEIAEDLGGVSRNAVIGKAHRLGLESRPSPVKGDKKKKAAAKKKPAAKKAAPKKAAPKTAPKKTAASQKAQSANSAPKAESETAKAAAAAAKTSDKKSDNLQYRSVGPGGFIRQGPSDTQAPIPPAPPRRLIPEKPSEEVADKTSLLDLNERICRWPMGHPGESDFHFCGEPANPGFPYCVEHCGVAYQAQLPRRDRKPPPPLPFGGPRVR
ncbi:MAG: GcrA cell cycle regulator [Sphingomonas sp.]|nr:GcrA cell cycle regulator [Sphingomonas sp.]